MKFKNLFVSFLVAIGMISATIMINFGVKWLIDSFPNSIPYIMFAFLFGLVWYLCFRVIDSLSE